MTNLYEYSWLIPFIPLSGALFIGILLFFFNRTMNRLSKPVFAITIICTTISALLSYFLLAHELETESLPYTYVFHADLFSNTYELNLFADLISSTTISVVCTVALVAMILTHKSNYRKVGYVRKFVSIGFVLSSVLIVAFVYPLSSLVN